ncbi:UNVERIFIED_CONTAM: hypothetical protein GTU68_013494 [Idotea baltica]|nr:hypothetical protein [Idotea baltica]
MVFQQFNLFPHLTVLENLTVGPVYALKTKAAEAREHAMRLLERVRVGDQAEKFPGQLSGGQQQRVAIARARLITDPQLLAVRRADNRSARSRKWSPRFST